MEPIEKNEYIMNEIDAEIKSEVLDKARKNGFADKCEIVVQERYAQKMKPNLRRLVELCLEISFCDFSDEVFIKLEPQAVMQLKWGEFRLGGREADDPHIPWHYLIHIYNAYDKKYLQAVIECVVAFNSKTVFCDKVTLDDLTSCREMLLYIKKNYGESL